MNRNDEIRLELTANNLPVTEEAIEGVKEYLKVNRRATVKSACKRLAAAYHEQSIPTQKAEGELNGKLASVANQLRVNIKKQVIGAALKGALEDFKNGDFGDLTDATVNELDTAIDTEYRFLELRDLDPKYALPSSDSMPSQDGERMLSSQGQSLLEAGF